MTRVMTDSSCNGNPSDRPAWQQDDLQESRCQFNPLDTQPHQLNAMALPMILEDDHRGPAEIRKQARIGWDSLANAGPGRVPAGANVICCQMSRLRPVSGEARG